MHEGVQVSFEIRDEKDQGHKNGVTAMQLDPLRGKLYSSGRDGIIRVWDTAPEVQNRFVQSLEQHTNWINDIVLCCGGEHLISASSDATIKLWNTAKGNPTASLPHHGDHVNALAYAKERELLTSGGRDGVIFVWDVNTLTRLTMSNNLVKPFSLTGKKNSIHSLAISPDGNILLAGSSGSIIRVWDPSTGARKWKLVGHTDAVNALVVSQDGQQTLSGSADGTIRLWSLKQQRCVSSIKVHQDQVTALLATEDFSHVISGGRDKRVIVTDLHNQRNCVVVCEEIAPILKLCFTADQKGIWVSTVESDLRCWELPPLNDLRQKYVDNKIIGYTKKVYRSSAMTSIVGAPAITEFKVLNNKRHLLTKDTDNKIILYDVLKACKIGELNEFDLEEVQRRFDMTYVPDWFKVDVDTGILKIHLRQQDPNCFGVWVNNKAAGLTNDEDKAVNLGVLLLQALLEHWKHLQNKSEDGEISIGNGYFKVPPHTPVTFSEVDSWGLLKLQIGEAAEEEASTLLKDIVPRWVTSVVEDMDMPKLVKISFYLLPHTESSPGTIKQKKDRIAVDDCTLCHKIAEHVLQKLYNDQCTLCKNGSNSECKDECDSKSGHRVELMCADQVLDPNMDLRTVLHLIWKSNEELTMYYNVIKLADLGLNIYHSVRPDKSVG